MEEEIIATPKRKKVPSDNHTKRAIDLWDAPRQVRVEKEKILPLLKELHEYWDIPERNITSLFVKMIKVCIALKRKDKLPL